MARSSRSTPTASSSAAPAPATTARPPLAGIRRSSRYTACDYCRTRKQRCEVPARETSCRRCLDGGKVCEWEPASHARTDTTSRGQDALPTCDARTVPSDFALKDIVPEDAPNVPLRGTKSAPLDTLLAELNAAHVAYILASNDLKAAKSAEAAATDTLNSATDALNAAKATLDTASAAHKAVSRRVSDASACSTRALERRQFAWDLYLTLRAARVDKRSPSSPSLPSLALASPAGHGSVRIPSPGAEGDTNDLNDDVFEGFLENHRGSGASDVDAMEVAQYL